MPTSSRVTCTAPCNGYRCRGEHCSPAWFRCFAHPVCFFSVIFVGTASPTSHHAGSHCDIRTRNARPYVVPHGRDDPIPTCFPSHPVGATVPGRPRTAGCHPHNLPFTLFCKEGGAHRATGVCPFILHPPLFLSATLDNRSTKSGQQQRQRRIRKKFPRHSVSVKIRNSGSRARILKQHRKQ